MPGGRRFRLEGERVVHETIEGETIAIDLTTGTYFSLTGTGPAIWSALVAGASEDAVLAAITRADPAAAQSSAAFIEELVQEGLLEPSSDASGEAGIELPAGPLAPPRLERYSDMEHLLLLDPIHEVHATG